MKRSKSRSNLKEKRKHSRKKTSKKLGQIISCRTPQIFVKKAAKKIIELVNEMIAVNNQCNIALSGGNTPLPIFRKIVAVFHNKTDWEKINFFWTDERCVSPEHPESNFGNAYREFLSKLPVKHYFRMEGELKPSVASMRYEKLIRNKFHLKKNQLPLFDLICLGVGNDGHIASLFPNSELLKEKKKLVASAFVKQANQNRITLTFPVLRNAKKRLFLVAGKEKAKILSEIFYNTKKKYPVHKLFPSKAEDIWIICKI